VRKSKEIKSKGQKLKIKSAKVKTISLLTFTLLTLVFLSGCKIKYSFTGGTVPTEAKTMSVLYFQNAASLAPPTLSQQFSEALRDRLSSQTRLSLIPKGGDLNFEGTITGYTTSPIAVQSTDLAALNRLTITVNVKYTCTFDEKKNFEQSFSRFADYGSDKSLSSVENDLIKEINEQLTQDVINRAFNDW